MLLPKTDLTLKELRARAKARGYKVKSQSVDFNGDKRIVWHLVSIATGTHYYAGGVYSEDKSAEVKDAFSVTKALVNGGAL